MLNIEIPKKPEQPEKSVLLYSKALLNGHFHGLKFCIKDVELDEYCGVLLPHHFKHVCYMITITTHYGENLNLKIYTLDKELDQTIFDLLCENIPVSKKLSKLTNMALEMLTTEQQSKMLYAIYQAGKTGGKIEIRKRWKQLMEGRA
jgi:hypothetical protein